MHIYIHKAITTFKIMNISIIPNTFLLTLCNSSFFFPQSQANIDLLFAIVRKFHFLELYINGAVQYPFLSRSFHST